MAMQKKSLGNSDLKVPALCVGCWQFNDNQMDGSKTWSGQSFETSQSIVNQALELGLNFFDTAEAYLNSEDVLGRILEGRRSTAVLASKFGYGAHKKTDYTAVDVERSLTDTLQRLRTDYLDLYQIHWPPVVGENASEVVNELERQKSLGRIRYYGVSNFGRRNLEAFLAAGGKPISNQICYNLLSRGCEFEILPYCVEKNISILPYSPLQQGLLSGKYLQTADVPEGRRRTRHFHSSSTELSRHGQSGCEKELFEAISGIKALCETEKIKMSSTALAWLLRQPQVSSVVVGAASSDQILANTELPYISDDLDTRLKKISEPLKESLGSNCDFWGETSRVF
ncbi:aldo-keto reductase IolS-like [Watersipora subatra]|uniref:aldo-keto reductase IolS-like n=1 Tax=Watersipora subatra TaxID=2589382 RepID=UPI00355B5125